MPELDQPNDRRYTDPRFPSLEIRNDGGPVFVVLEDGEPFDEFKAYELPGVNAISQPFAQRRAQQYYDRMASGQMSAELQARNVPEPQRQLAARRDPQPINRLNYPASRPAAKSAPPHPKGPLGSPIPAGERFGGPQDLDAFIAQIRQEPDPQRAARLKKQALSWMQQENAAQRIVRLLLSL